MRLGALVLQTAALARTASASSPDAPPPQQRPDKARQKRFIRVWKQNLWGSAESKSGRGSERSIASPDRDFLLKVIRSYYGDNRGPTSNITIVDAPCGDMNWVVELLQALEGLFGTVTYHGYDIVPEAIRSHRQRFASKPQWHFHRADLVDAMPVKGDVLLCRDLLNHLSLADGRRVLHNVLMSRTPIIVLSNNQRDVTHNQPLGAADGGESRELDVTKPPFSWPRPAWGNGHLWVWRMRPPRTSRRRGIRGGRAAGKPGED